jgi:hypothetical protein
MSEWSRGAAWCPRPPSLCTAAAAAWYVRAMYEQQSCSKKPSCVVLYIMFPLNGLWIAAIFMVPTSNPQIFVGPKSRL